LPFTANSLNSLSMRFLSGECGPDPISRGEAAR
jgi:hypothetical protein